MKTKNILITVFAVLVGVLLGYFIFNKRELKLPLPEVTGGERGMLGIDKNINEETIDK